MSDRLLKVVGAIAVIVAILVLPGELSGGDDDSSAGTSSRASQPSTGAARPFNAADFHVLSHREFAKLLLKAPEASAGDRVLLHGQVFQFDAATGAELFLADVGSRQLDSSSGYYGYADRMIRIGFPGG